MKMNYTTMSVAILVLMEDSFRGMEKEDICMYARSQSLF